MKKIASLLIALITYNALAQNFISKESYSSDSFKSSKQVQYSNERSILWSDDFSDPATWVIDHDATACNLDWEIGTNLECGGFYPIATISSTTYDNGCAMIDSDEYGGEQGGSDVEDSWITTANPIDLSASNNVILQFETWYRSYNSEKCFIVTSTNNADWPHLTPDFDASSNPNVYEAFPGISGIPGEEMPSNPTEWRLNISESAGSESQVWIRFHWTGTWGYAWFIDDVAIIEQPDNDIVLKTANVSTIDGLKYGRIPVNHIDESIMLEAEIVNLGANMQSNIAIEMTIEDDFGNEVISESFSHPLLESDSSINIESIVNGFTFYEGMYTLNAEVVSDGDSVGINNMQSTNLQVTENIYSLDGIGVYDNNVLNTGRIGTNFGNATVVLVRYDLREETTVQALEILLDSDTNIGGTIFPFLITEESALNGDLNARIAENEEGITIEQSHVDDGLISVPLEPTIVPAGAYYVCAQLFNGEGVNDKVYIVDDETVDQPDGASMIFTADNGQTWSNGNAAAIRLVLENIEVYGCTEEQALNYNPNATIDDGSCMYCETPIYVNVETDSLNNGVVWYIEDDNGVFDYSGLGSTDYCFDSGCFAITMYSDSLGSFDNTNMVITDQFEEVLFNYTFGYETSETVTFSIGNSECNFGCTSIFAINYNPDATVNDGSCEYEGNCPDGEIEDCNGNCAPEGWYADGICDNGNYQFGGNLIDLMCFDNDGGDCIVSLGCTDETALNYNEFATEDDGSCEYEMSGCVTKVFDEPMYLPDGSGMAYSSTIEINGYGGQHLTDADYLSVFINLEHSYAGDLDIYLTAPNGEQVQLFGQAGGATWFGEASDGDATENNPGLGYEYGWSMNPSYNGTMLDAMNNGHTVPDPAEGFSNILISDTYLPVDSFDILEGTPINGAWELTVIDNLTIDNGWVFSWGISTCNLLGGCTDIDAINYNPMAIEDDGSCEYQNDCEFPYHWNVINTGANHTFMIPEGIMLNNEVIPNGSAIGVLFMNDQGIYQCAGYSLIDGGMTSVAVMADDSTTPEIDGLLEGEEPIWAIWHSGHCEEIYIGQQGTSYSGGPEVYTTNGISFIEYFDNISCQEVQFPEGWFIYSSYIETESMNVVEVFNPIVDAINIIKDNEGEVYLPQWNYNGIGDLQFDQGYQVKTYYETSIDLCGDRMKPEDHPIFLEGGWNLVSYLREYPASVDEVMADLLMDNNLIIVKDYNGEVYLPQWNYNGIGDMHSGQGYQLKLNQDAVLHYLSDIESYRLSTVQPIEHKELQYYSSSSATDNNMTIIIEDAAWDILPSENAEIAVFDALGNLVGSTEYTSPVTVLTTWGDDFTSSVKDGLCHLEQFTFELRSQDETRSFVISEWSQGSLKYISNAINVAAEITSEEDVKASIDLFDAIPNPTSVSTLISFYLPSKAYVNISVYNVLGELVEELTDSQFESGYHKLALNSAELEPGMYYFTMQSDEFEKAKQLIVYRK